MLRVINDACVRALSEWCGWCVCGPECACAACMAMGAVRVVRMCVPTKCERVRDGSVRVEREGGVHVQSVDEVSVLATARIVTDSYIGF